MKEENVEQETEDESLNASQVKWDAKSGKLIKKNKIKSLLYI